MWRSADIFIIIGTFINILSFVKLDPSIEHSDSGNHKDVIVVHKDSNDSSGLVKIVDEPILLISTIEGYLYRVDKYKGSILWKMKEDPILRTSTSTNPILFPDPMDGSLYRIVKPHGSADVISRLPHTIPDLVSKSPMYFSGEYMCTGGKRDVWLHLDLESGQKLSTVGLDWREDHCPKQREPQEENNATFFLGRSEYSLSLKDPKSHHVRWNLTYTTYSTHSVMAGEDYDLKHVTASQSGVILTIDKMTRKLMWNLELDSAVVGIYLLKSESVLHKIPQTSMGSETVNLILSETQRTGTIDFLFTNPGSRFPIVPTLYVGEHSQALYAICSATHNTASVRGQSAPGDHLLIDGPSGADNPVGHYVSPHPPKPAPNVNARHRITDQSSWGTISNLPLPIKPVTPDPSPRSNMDVWIACLMALIAMGTAFVFLKHFKRKDKFKINQSQLPPGWVAVGNLIYDPTHILGTGSNGTMVFKGRFDDRDVAVKRLVRNDTQPIGLKETDLLRKSYEHPNVVKYFYTETSMDFHFIALELCQESLESFAVSGDQMARFGLDSIEALKQITQGVDHLHSQGIIHRDLKPVNVLLKFCGHNRYPDAVSISNEEPPSASTNGKSEQEPPSASTNGKSDHDTSGSLPLHRVIISDFGLCRQLGPGRADMTKGTVVDGTEGWIAPEFSREDVTKVTSSVDIFSSGCLFYFVLSKGGHPFGQDPISRQYKIKRSEYSLHGVADQQNNTAHCLIESMIDNEPIKRPMANEILEHPLFWTPQKRLQFIVEISDFVDKRCNDIKTLVPSLEEGAKLVFRSNWQPSLSTHLMASLIKQRPYQGDMLRDLIRAIRNKKNHFYEMPSSMRDTLGGDLVGYLSYFTQRFPGLLPWLYRWARESVSTEVNFNDFFVLRGASPRCSRRTDKLKRFSNKTSSPQRQVLDNVMEPIRSNEFSTNQQTRFPLSVRDPVRRLRNESASSIDRNWRDRSRLDSKCSTVSSTNGDQEVDTPSSGACVVDNTMEDDAIIMALVKINTSSNSDPINCDLDQHSDVMYPSVEVEAGGDASVLSDVIETCGDATVSSDITEGQTQKKRRRPNQKKTRGKKKKSGNCISSTNNNCTEEHNNSDLDEDENILHKIEC